MYKITIADALNHPMRGFIPVRDVDTDEATIRRTIDKFRWLVCGIETTRFLAAIEDDVRGDGELFLMLNAPAATFVDWFKTEDYSIYEVSEVLRDDEEWPGVVLKRTLALAAEGRWFLS